MPDTPDTWERQPNPERKGCGFKNIGISVNWKLWYPLISLWDWNKNYFDRHKAMTIKCFFSHCPVSCDGGSVGRAKKEWMNEHLPGSGFHRRPGCWVRKPGYKVNSKTWSFRLSNVYTAFKKVVWMLIKDKDITPYQKLMLIKQDRVLVN